MVTRGSPYLITNNVSPCSREEKFPLLSLVWYLFDVVRGSSCQIRGNNVNALFITTTGNVFVARWAQPFVTRPILDFVMIH